MGLHVFFGCYFNLFRLMAKCGVLENLLLKDHTHTFCNLDGDVKCVFGGPCPTPYSFIYKCYYLS